jgi:hypothetical protein
VALVRLTERDVRLLRDLVLSHVLTRDQMIALGYFGSVTRANTRLRALRGEGLVKAIDTPFFGQTLHAALPGSAEVVEGRLAALASFRTGSPRHIQHALCTTNIRLAMLAKGVRDWRFEPELRRRFRYGGRDLEVRPDGMGIENGRVVAVEADLGNVAPAKFREKLRAYHAFAESGECRRAWGQESFTLLVVTPDEARAERLARLRPDPCGYALACRSHARLGIAFAHAWS